MMTLHTLPIFIVFHLVTSGSFNITTTSQHTTTTTEATSYFSTNVALSVRFSLCRKLNEYGCNPTQIPNIMVQYINSGITDYTLPTDPCLFESINTSYIFSHVDASILSLIPGNSYFATVPCQILVQLHSLLSERDATYLINDDYWFSDNNGQCDTHNINNNPYNITICNYTTTTDNDNNNTAIATENCFDDDRCFYPFVRTQNHGGPLVPFGQCHCMILCDFRFYGGDITVLDSFNKSCIWISLTLIIGYFINLFLELKHVKSGGQKIMDLPLTFDIPFFCASALLSMTICALLPYLISKNYFTCETGTDAYIKQVDLPNANWSCFIQGSIIYISFMTIYTYFMVLSVCVWRYLAAPMRPLFGIHKKYFHLAIWVYILGMYVGLVSKVHDKSMSANTILGICGSNFFRPWSYIFNWYPTVINVSVFAIITPLTLYKLRETIKYSQKTTMGQDKFANDLVNLSLRLLLYTFFLCVSCICFMYIIGELLFREDKWGKIAEDYVMCLVFESYLIDSGLSGDYDECVLDPNNELPISIYFMQGTIVLLASLASFVLSCSSARYTQWKHVKDAIESKTKYIRSIKKENIKETPHPSNGQSNTSKKTSEIPQMIKATSASVDSAIVATNSVITPTLAPIPPKTNINDVELITI